MSMLRTPGGRRPSLARQARPFASGVSSVARSVREGTAPVAPRIAVAGVVGAVIIGILLLRLWALTVLNGAEYAERADSNVVRKLPIAAPRGSILDRRGKQIVVNREMQQVVLDLQDIDPDRLDGVIVELGRVLAPAPSKVRERTEEIRAAVDAAPPGAIEPVVVARDERREAVLHYLAEHNADFPGVDVRSAFAREYPRGSLAAHILGQDGLVSPEELEGEYANLQPGDRVGKSGLEKRYDEYIRGTNGYDAVQVDAAGVRTDVVGLRGLPPVPGRNLRTTIDLDLQKAAEEGLRAAIASAQRTAKGRDARAGAVVAIDPRTGEILTLASQPSYNPGVFTSPEPKDQATVRRLIDPKNRSQPLLNRAIAGQYPPASTFKPITAFAAFDKGWATPDTVLQCPPVLNVRGTPFKNHVSEHLGGQTIVEALETSCDTYFYQLALYDYNAPSPVIAEWAEKFGIGRSTGLDLPGEAVGRAPTPDWKAEVDNPYWNEVDHLWKPGDSINMSIGQGDLLATPLQMTNVYAAIANGGILHEPRLARSIDNANGRQAIKLPKGTETDLGLDRKALAKIREGLIAVNNGGNGTGSGVFQGFKVLTAGKTGTAEKTGQSDLAWYCGYAPADKPTIAACAFVDGGGGGSTTAAPVVLRMYQEYFNAKGGNARGVDGGD